MLIDFPLDQLRRYVPPRDEPTDFDAFWQATLGETGHAPLSPVYAPVDVGLATVETFDVTFSGYAGQPIKGWLLLPRQRTGQLPCVVEYVGYGGGRGFPTDWLLWSSVGYAHLVMDTRGQGSAWLKGDTPDPEVDGANPHHPGFMTRGILRPATYYYRRVFADAVRAVETARAHPAVDASRVAVTGGSQGGGIALAVSGLVPDVQAVLPDVPFLCHYRRATEITDAYPYQEIVRYLMIQREQRGGRLCDAGLLRRPELRAARPRAGAVLGRVDGRDLPAIHGLRGLQPLRWPEGDPGVAVQPPRGRWDVPGPRESPLPAPPLGIGRQAEAHECGCSLATDRGRLPARLLEWARR
jgi:cephalosporin-C deacetylase